MTVDRLKEENRRLRRRLRETKDALRDAEDTTAWVVDLVTGRRPSELAALRQEARP